MEAKVRDRKWHNYFYNMRNKYDMRLSANKPIVLFLEAKASLKSKTNLLDDKKNGFFDAMTLAAKYFTIKYNCIAIGGTKEISFVIENTDDLIQSINNEKKYRVHDVAAIFSQYFFEQFNNIYDGEKVYWTCKCFNISKEKIESYLRFKSKGIQKRIVEIFLQQQGDKSTYGIKLEEKIKKCQNYESYSLIEEYKDGILYYNGKKIKLNEYLKGHIVILKDQKDTEEFFDLTDFDSLL